MKILSIDTSNYPLGVALIDEEKVIGEYITNFKRNHSVRAMPAVEQLLKECETEPKELTKIVVANGPGSYTGVRIGVTMAKTLAWSLNIPLVPVSSLAVLASSGRHFNGFISPIFDARRGQVYTGLYKFEGDTIQQIEEDRNLLLADWVEKLKEYDGEILFVGNDVGIHEAVIKEVLGDQARIAPFVSHNPRPSELAFIGAQMEEKTAHEVVPNYIRLAEAEVKWLEAQKNSK
ncbi:tRNA threonylcarbamoyladenosine biosynthesis protein TsaB [[Bacillus] enclensis]|jgi:tRNA threonylcarbamoyladenosine biosynthesis protein TsaB|uniref:tRNA threonylcarbamoyladenosine biosynthesis protein TsaB n=1 Tax=[Bacillus] enclensis TaxID=1402860 RepID=A0A0V8H540_9BACI|nr:tRNA (adenosine(37)-N6)-threonylcarbamoyltransferase complex dimerization subunit type 1 TsaB [[Bacillus] enclensis]KSU57590.1 tRNA threonylcarbamoyladenosine biosynthesis protein TsaB [[Bacillus] enclensis]MBH9968869.1 tRNA (adenosine(37)-N6)-threonylcarbamoyltransferase complex dimerization subunit type 1 TsaB [[Bacillus] enclensis]OAT84763.1 tRNA N6-adenosine(37)-N6-threonylcarbamoyltransferase complex dimerization subunit TsaB [Bacillus sp. MKU004]SCC36795.1 tRNA threonylcarbamoyladenosi